MSRRNASIAAACAVLLAALAYIYWPSGHASHDSEQIAEAVAQQRGGERAALVPGQRQPADLGGLVVDAAGTPVPGATVSLAQLAVSRGERATPGSAPRPIAVVTDGDGRFSIAAIAPGRYSASASAQGFLPGRKSPIVLAPGEQRSGVEIVITRGGHTLSGIVSDIGGGPVHGALVRATKISEGDVFEFFRAPATAASDGDGRYAITLGDGAYMLEVFHLDYVGTQSFTQIRGTDRTENFELVPGGIVFGQVRSRATDEPIAGATVTYMAAARGGRRGINFQAIAGLGMRSSVTDADGKFTLRGLNTGAVEVRAFGPGYASREPTAIAMGIGETVNDVIIYVDRAFTIAGKVVDKDADNPGSGAAISGVLLGAFNFGGTVHLARQSSGDDGSFAIHGVQNGTYFVGAAGQERVVNVLGTNVSVDNADVVDLVIELDAGVTLRGRVEPANAARVALEVDRESIGLGTIASAFAAATVRGRADEDGSFELKGVPSGTFKLVARADDGSSGSLDVEIAEGDQDGLVIRMESRGSISGFVVNSSGEAVEGLNVAASRGRRSTFSLSSFLDGRAVTGPDGQFEILGLQAGQYDVSVSDSRGTMAWGDKSGDDEHAADAPHKVTIEGSTPVTGLRLVVESRSQSISGTVIGPDGNPVSDAWVTAKRGMSSELAKQVEAADKGADNGERRRRRRQRRGWGGSEKPALTDADGHFEIKDLRDASYDLEAEGLKGDARGLTAKVKSGTSGVTIKLESLAKVSGRVTHLGKPVQSFVISATGPVSRRRNVVSNDGEFTISRLEPGEYRLAVVAEEGRAGADVDVKASGTATKNLQLVAYGSVHGVVKDAATGEPMEDLSVAAFSELGSDTESMAMSFLAGEGPRSNTEGRFRVGRLGAGKGTLIVFDGDAAGFDIVAQKEFELEPGQALDVGELLGTSAIRVPKTDRGVLGMELTAATWADRPITGVAKGGGGSDDPPEGVDPEVEQLWVESVTDDGAARRAGIQAGDRVISVAGIAVEQVGAKMIEQMLNPRRIKAGEPIPFVVEHQGRTDNVTVTPSPQLDDE